MSETEKPTGEWGVGQSWAALRKNWKGFKIAKVKADKEGMTKYAQRIQTIQRQLIALGAKCTVSAFPDLGIPA